MNSKTRVLSRSQEMRVFAAVAVQPFLASAVALVSSPIVVGQSGSTLDPIGADVSLAIATGIVALFVTLIGALPTAVWLLKRGDVPLTQALLLGLAFGNLPFVLGTILAGSYGVAGFVRGATFSSLLGVAGAAMFWMIALRDRGLQAPGVDTPGR